MASKSKGEELVRVSFNPENNDSVSELKKQFAELINNVDKLSNEKTGRHVLIAITRLEEACMFAVKAATA